MGTATIRGTCPLRLSPLRVPRRRSRGQGAAAGADFCSSFTPGMDVCSTPCETIHDSMGELPGAAWVLPPSAGPVHSASVPFGSLVVGREARGQRLEPISAAALPLAWMSALPRVKRYTTAWENSLERHGYCHHPRDLSTPPQSPSGPSSSVERPGGSGWSRFLQQLYPWHGCLLYPV